MFVDPLGLSGAFNSGTGVLTLTGSATLSDYEAALRSIKYRYTGTEPSASKEIEFKVSDGDGDSNTASKTILIGAPPE